MPRCCGPNTWRRSIPARIKGVRHASSVFGVLEAPPSAEAEVFGCLRRDGRPGWRPHPLAASRPVDGEKALETLSAIPGVTARGLRTAQACPASAPRLGARQVGDDNDDAVYCVDDPSGTFHFECSTWPSAATTFASCRGGKTSSCRRCAGINPAVTFARRGESTRARLRTAARRRAKRGATRSAAWHR